MKFKGTLILLGLFVIVGAIAYFYDYKGGPRRAEQEKSSKRLIAVDKTKVKELHLQYPDKAIVGVREGEGRWKITAPVTTTGDGAEWDRLVSQLADLEQEKVVEENPTDLKPLGLDPPALKISVTADGGKISQVWFGFANPAGSSVYAKVPDKKEVVLVSNMTYQGIKKDLLDLRERNLLKFNQFNADALSLKNSHGAFTLAKADSNWQIKEPVAAPAEGSEVSTILNTLSTTKVSDFVDYNPPSESEMGFDRPAITLAVTDHKEADASGSTKEAKEVSPVSHPLLIGAAKAGSELYYARDPARRDIMLVERSVVDKLNRSLFDLRSKEIAAFHRFEVDGIDIISGTETLVLRKDKNQWYLGPTPAAQTAPGGDASAPKDTRPKIKSDKILSMFNALESHKVVEFIDRPTGLATYGLERPRVEVVLWKGEDRLAQLLFGHDARPSVKQPASGQRFCYLKLKNEPYVKIVNKDVFDPFKVVKADLLETEPKP